jgi:L-amino acid N-acyltransferase YncA
MTVEIREAGPEDWPGIWAIFRAVVGTGETYAYAPDITEEVARASWAGPPATAYVAVEEGRIVGTYTLKPNQPGLGAHVANAGFMVTLGQAGKGIGRAMGRHALEEARRAGYLAMQFNFVASTNARAVALWQSLGFAIVGTVPQAFRHRRLGLVDVHVMHRFL